MKKYIFALKSGFSSSMEQRFDFFISLLSTVFPIIIQVFLWQTIYGGSNDQIYGYTYGQMMVYIIMAGVVNLFVTTNIEWVVNQDIHSGALGSYLCKPINYIAFRFFHTWGVRMVSAFSVTLLAITALIIAHFFFGFTVPIIYLLLFLLTIILAVFLKFFIFLLISLSGMWLTEVGSFFSTISVVVMVISGGVFPISVFGDTFVEVTSFLPFLYTTYFPVSVITGAIGVSDVFTGIIIQLVWILILLVLSFLVWQAGVKRYVAVGG